MTGRHLGRSVHDLLDGRLDRNATAEAMAHLASCEECSGRYEELREARQRLTSSPAGIDMSFARQLLDRDRMAEIAANENPHHVKAVRPPDHRPRMLALGALVAVVGGVGAAYVVGAPDTLSTDIAAAGTNDGSAVTVASYRAQELSGTADLGDWVSPFGKDSDITGVQAAVKSLPNGAQGLVMTVVSGVESVVVTEQHGRLDQSFAELPTITTDDLTLYVLHGSTTTVVWQNGDYVITASCNGCEAVTLLDVADAFPMDAAPGVVDRISTGLVELADAVVGTD